MAIRLVVVLNLGAKATLLVFLALVLMNPSWGNLEGKAPVARAITYPMWAFLLAVAWHIRPWAKAYPWVADLLLTLTCFTDILGNRLDLYDAVVWFDDAVHLTATGLLSAAVLLLAVPSRRTFLAMAERAVAAGMTAALAWEVFEYVSFLTRSSELPTAYPDTVGDLALGWVGSVAAAAVVASVLGLVDARDRQRPAPRAEHAAASGR